MIYYSIYIFVKVHMIIRMYYSHGYQCTLFCVSISILDTYMHTYIMCVYTYVRMHACMYIYIYMPDYLLRVNISNLQSFCLDVTQGHMNEAPNETRTHSCRFASLACPQPEAPNNKLISIFA